MLRKYENYFKLKNYNTVPEKEIVESGVFNSRKVKAAKNFSGDEMLKGENRE